MRFHSPKIILSKYLRTLCINVSELNRFLNVLSNSVSESCSYNLHTSFSFLFLGARRIREDESDRRKIGLLYFVRRRQMRKKTFSDTSSIEKWNEEFTNFANSISCFLFRAFCLQYRLLIDSVHSPPSRYIWPDFEFVRAIKRLVNVDVIITSTSTHILFFHSNIEKRKNHFRQFNGRDRSLRIENEGIVQT